MVPIWHKLAQIGLVIALFHFLWKVVRASFTAIDSENNPSQDTKRKGVLEPIHRLNATDLSELVPFTFSGDTVTIGRSQENDVTIDDRFVSLQHARLVWKHGRYYLEDVNSTNHTYVNDKLVKSSCPLQEGDMITLGETILRFSYRLPENSVSAGN